VYPLQLYSFNNGLTLYAPEPALIKPTYQHLVAENPATIFPYWAKIWGSAHAMSDFLIEEPTYTENKKVLEIGAGIGLPSLSIAKQTKKIVISDYAPEAVALIQKNIDHLKLSNARSACIDWNTISEDIIADTVILSDTNYEPGAHNHLVLLIDKFINKGSTIILATPNRIASKPFIERISKYIASTKKYIIPENDAYTEIVVMVLEKYVS
jgi:predicted nicotinamide N-methyase